MIRFVPVCRTALAAMVVAVVAILALPQSAHAQRPSLATIDAKLDALLAASGGAAVVEVVNLVEQDSLGSGSALTLPVDLITVPAQKRLVITSVAVDTGLNTCSFTLNARLRISTPSLVMFPLGRVFASTLGLSNVRYINQGTFPVTIFAEAGNVVRFDLFRSSTNCSSLVRVGISGYLVDAP